MATIFMSRVGSDSSRWDSHYPTHITTTPTISQQPRDKYLLWNNDHHPLPQLHTMLEAAGISDPTGARELLDKARTLHHNAISLTISTPSPQQMAGDYYAGKISTEDFIKNCKQYALESTTAKTAQPIARELLETASRAAQNQALKELLAFGERFISDVLKPRAQEILKAAAKPTAKHDELNQQWNALSAVAKLLHGWILPGIDANEHELMFKRPDRVHDWRLNNSTTIKEHERWIHNGTRHIVFYPREGAPTLTLKVILENAHEWEPSVYTADEISNHYTLWNTAD